jgi:hypothetical protein
MTTLNQLSQEIYSNAVAHGWWGDLSDYQEWHVRGTQRNFGEVIALIHSEASEALEEHRNGHAYDEVYYKHGDGTECKPDVVCKVGIGHAGGAKPEGIPIEFADIIIRVLDASAALGIDIDDAVRTKMVYNKTRPFKHGGKRM